MSCVLVFQIVLIFKLNFIKVLLVWVWLPEISFSYGCKTCRFFDMANDGAVEKLDCRKNGQVIKSYGIWCGNRGKAYLKIFLFILVIHGIHYYKNIIST